MCCECQEHPYCFKPSHWCIGFIIIYSFFLRIPFCNQYCFIPRDNSITIQFIFEYPLGANYRLVLWPGYRLSHFQSFELIEFFLHRNNPIWIFTSFFYFLLFYFRQKTREVTFILRSTSCLKSSLRINYNQFPGMISTLDPFPWKMSSR